MKAYACLLLLGVTLTSSAPLEGDAVVFREDAETQARIFQPVELQPPELPVIPHLENDPSTIPRAYQETSYPQPHLESVPPTYIHNDILPPKEDPIQHISSEQLPPFLPTDDSPPLPNIDYAPVPPPPSPSVSAYPQVVPPSGEAIPDEAPPQLEDRFAIPNPFKFSKNEQGEYTASFAANMPNIFGGSTAHSHSFAIGGDFHKGLSLSHSSSRSSTTGEIAKFFGLSGSHSKTEASSLNAGISGVSSAHSKSTSGSVQGNFFGKNFAKSGSESGSVAAGLGHHGIAGAFGASKGIAEAFDGKTKTESKTITKTFGHGAHATANQASHAVSNFGQTIAGSNAGSSAGVNLGTGFSSAATNAGSSVIKEDLVVFSDQGRIFFDHPQQQVQQVPPRWQQYDVPAAGSNGYQIIKFEI